MITLSGLQHAANCPGSASFPRAEEAPSPESALGSAIHALIDGRAKGHADVGALAAAHALSDDDAGRLAFVAAHMALPIPTSAKTEVSLGYFADGSARPVTKLGPGRYLEEPGNWLPGTLDGMWFEGDTLWVYDAKTGEPENVPPPHANWQLRAGAVMAARWTGARRVVTAICFISPASISAALRAAREAREKAGVAAEMAGREATIDGDIPAGLAALDRMREHLAAAEAHEREAAQGRWEIGETLDGAALDAIEVEMRAVLARARGESDEKTGADETGGCAGGDSIALAGQGGAEEGYARGGGSALGRTHSRASSGAASLILGAHCTHCHAAPVCPALSAFALTAARQSKADLETLDAATVAGLWAKVPALRRMADAIEVTARAWARKSDGTLRLPDGREYGPAVEERRSYDTARTFDVLVPFVGEERANRAAKYTWASIERALKDAGAPPAAYAQVRKDLEAAGAVVVTSHEEWGYRQPAKPVEVDDGQGQGSDGHRGARALAGSVQENEGGGEPAGARGELPRSFVEGVDKGPAGETAAGAGEAAGSLPVSGHDEADAASGGNAVQGLPDAKEGLEGADAVLSCVVAARGPCPICLRTYALRGGILRAHYQQAPRRGVRCTGSGGPPGEAPVYEAPWLPAPVESARAEPQAGEAPRQLAIVGA